MSSEILTEVTACPKKMKESWNLIRKEQDSSPF